MKTESRKCLEVLRYGPGNFKFYCTFCTKEFKWQFDIRDHIETHFLNDDHDLYVKTKHVETEKLNSLSAEILPANQNIIDIKNEPVANEQNCIEMFVLENGFQEFVVEYNSDYSDCLDQTQKEPTKLEQIKEPSSKEYEKSSEYNMHPKFGTISSNDMAKCDICKCRLLKGNMVTHMRKHDSHLKRYVCSICTKRFHREPNLKRHMTSVHSNSPKQYCCQYCSHRFRYQYNLTAHIRIHTGEKPYKCEICSKAFNQQTALQIHIRTHTKEKPYQCEICNKLFTTNSMYWVHRRKHDNIKNFKCNTCDKGFTNSSELRNHAIIHTGERPFSCNVCNATFIKRFHYNQHLVLHTNEKPFKCRFCDIHFAQMAARRLHERSIHNDINRVVRISN